MRWKAGEVADTLDQLFKKKAENVILIDIVFNFGNIVTEIIFGIHIMC